MRQAPVIGWSSGLPVPAALKRVATLGDSITAGYWASDNGGYQKYAAPLLSAMGAIFVGSYNRTTVHTGALATVPPQSHDGVSGEQLANMDGRLDAMVTRLAPDVIVLLGGVNDMLAGFGNDQTIANHEYARGLIYAKGVPLVVVSLVPMVMDTVINGHVVNDASVQTVNAAVRAGVQAEADGGEKVVFADVHTPISAVTGWQGTLIESTSPDPHIGVHPLDAGFAVMGPVIAAAIGVALSM